MTDQQDRWVPEGGDDERIGVAFRRSLIGLLVVAAFVGLGIAVVAFMGEEAAAPLVKDTTAPEALVADTAILPEVRFTDITTEAGIDFTHVNGATGERLLPETMGSGAAFFDADADGDQDLLLVDAMAWPHDGETPNTQAGVLLLNDGTGSFSPSGWSLGPPMYGTGVACGDVDGDGLVDVYLGGVNADRLLRNTGGGFEDITHAAGLADGAPQWTSSPAFADVDNDGDLDLFVPHYIQWTREQDIGNAYTLNGTDRAYGPPKQYAGTNCALWLNDGGVFTDVSEQAGLHVANVATGVPVGKALAVAPVDIDADGDIDFIVANDTTRNFLFRNNGDGTFEEAGEATGLAYDPRGMATGAMGIDVGHYRNDDLLGVGIGNFANEMTSFYVDGGRGLAFSDEAAVEGIGAPTRPQLSFGLLLLDVDLDGRLDLFQTNGHLEEEIEAVQPNQHYRQPAQLFWNAGPSRSTCFEIVPPASTGDLATPIVGRGATMADIDADGDLDLLVTQPGEPPVLWRNDQATGHHWLSVSLDDEQSHNRNGLGAWIELDAGGITQRRQVQPTRSYLSQVALPVTFGLGDADTVDAVRVLWPDGQAQSVTPGAIDSSITVRRHSSTQ